MPRKYVTAPAYIRFNFGAVAAGDDPGEILITPADQMDAMTLTFTEMFSDQMSQASQSRADAVISGFNVEASISIADVGNMALFNSIFQGSDVLNTGSGGTLKQLTGIASRPGCPVLKRPTMIKLASCEGESTDPLDWFYLPSAALFTSDTSFSFSNSDQTSYTVTLSAFDPEPSSQFFPYKALRGDISAVGATGTRFVNLTPTTTTSIAEAGGTRTFTVTLSAVHTLAVSVPFTMSGTATAATDYTVTASPVSIAAGATSVPITITSLTDALTDPGETVILTLGTPTNAVLGVGTTATTTIT